MTYDKAELVALDKKYVWHHLTQHKNFEPAIYVKGEGMRITDIDGKTYLDAVSGGVWTVNVGYGQGNRRRRRQADDGNVLLRQQHRQRPHHQVL